MTIGSVNDDPCFKNHKKRDKKIKQNSLCHV